MQKRNNFDFLALLFRLTFDNSICHPQEIPQICYVTQITWKSVLPNGGINPTSKDFQTLCGTKFSRVGFFKNHKTWLFRCSQWNNWKNLQFLLGKVGILYKKHLIFHENFTQFFSKIFPSKIFGNNIFFC